MLVNYLEKTTGHLTVTRPLGPVRFKKEFQKPNGRLSLATALASCVNDLKQTRSFGQYLMRFLRRQPGNTAGQFRAVRLKPKMAEEPAHFLHFSEVTLCLTCINQDAISCRASLKSCILYLR
jgi:hypothetical protein